MADGTDAGSSGIPLVEALSQAAAAHDQGNLTKAGRALQKHGSRRGSAFRRPLGNSNVINQIGQSVVDGILHDPASQVTRRQTKRFGEVIEVRAHDGRGIRYDAAGNFIGLLEP